MTETVGRALEAGWRRVGFQRSTPPRGGLVTPGYTQMDGINASDTGLEGDKHGFLHT